MAPTFDEAHVNQYVANIHLMLEQKASVFKPIFPITASDSSDRHVFPRLGGSEAVLVASSYQETVRGTMEHSNRVAYKNKYRDGTYLDDLDKFKMLIDPRGDYVMRASSSLGRQFDKDAIQALIGDAHEGRNGTTAVALPAAQIIDETAAAFDVDTLIAAGQKFEEAELFGGNKYIAIRPDAKSLLLSNTQVTSADYNTVRTLASGQIDSFMGFKFVISNLLPAGTAIAFTDNALKVAMAHDLKVHTGQDMTHEWSWVVDVYMMFGMVRIEDQLVVKILY